MLVLASNSAARQMMLTNAGLSFEAVAPRVDEENAKEAFRLRGLSARDLADGLAELKAMRVSTSRPGDIVIGCDQTLQLDDGTMLDKPGDNVAAHLRRLSGRTHCLFSAVVAVENGQSMWRHVEKAKLTMRVLSDTFIDDYVARDGRTVAGCVGGYRIEGFGAQLFTKVEGDYFTILGLPLIPLLSWLRERGVLAS
jgi:septum formation protein